MAHYAVRESPPLRGEIPAIRTKTKDSSNN